MNEQLLAFFEERKHEYVSGELLSHYFQCSRTAVWKHIQHLKKKGYVFESVPRLGYKLVAKPEKIDAAKIMRELQTKSFGRNLILIEQTGSTQTLAQQQAAAGAEEGTLVIAEKQTAGRGRMGRKWHSPPGKGVYMSLILRPDIPLAFAPQLTALVSVALCRAIRNMCGIEIGIKWPNDLLFNGKKICGILLESRAEDEKLLVVIAGIGISVNLEEADFPDDIRNRATSLFIASGAKVDREKLIANFLRELEELYAIFRSDGFHSIRILWEALSVTLHNRVEVKTGRGIVAGIAEAIDPLGGLVVRKSDGKKTTVYSGEVGFTEAAAKRAQE
ncbi:MAG TPA: biotin--[acetyl-CoA-carboxylase] ligase [Bacilli bacterium]